MFCFLLFTFIFLLYVSNVQHYRNKNKTWGTLTALCFVLSFTFEVNVRAICILFYSVHLQFQFLCNIENPKNNIRWKEILSQKWNSLVAYALYILLLTHSHVSSLHEEYTREVEDLLGLETQVPMALSLLLSPCEWLIVNA